MFYFDLIDLWFKIHGPLLPNHFRTLYLSGALLSMMVAFIKVDILLGEVNYNLDPFKVLHFLMYDLKSEHKLTDGSYKKLVILSKMVQTGLTNYSGSIMIALSSTLILPQL